MRVTVICSNLRHDIVRLQPGRYVTEIVKYLQASGHSTTVITDTGDHAPDPSVVDGAEVRTVRTVRVSAQQNNPELQAKVRASRADVLLWMVGQSSFWHLSWPRWIEAPVVGLFTAPIYTPKEVLRLGITELCHSPRFYAFYLWSALAPDRLARRVLNSMVVSSVIVLSQAVRQRLLGKGISDEKLLVVPPGLDPEDTAGQVTASRGASERTLTALYLGSPQWYRGPDIAIRAVARLRDMGVPIRLTLLSRRSAGEFDRDERGLCRLVEKLGLQDRANIISGFLPAIDVQRHLHQADMVLLPFKLIPSEMPLTVIEGMRQGKPVITSALASMVDLLGEGRGLTVPPNRPDDLAEAMIALIDLSARREAIGQSAQTYVESWPTWGDTGRDVELILQRATCNGCLFA
jgi:glycosyltransferase involved in cell wall biosynthesis